MELPDFNPLISYVKRKHSVDKKFKSSCERKEIADIDILIKCGNSDRKIMQPIRITSGPDT